MMDHPFEVGSHYRNENGSYEVLEIDDERMQIRYDDGTEQSAKVEIQARIWQRIQDEAGPPLQTYQPGQQSQDIQPVIDLVAEVLRTKFGSPYPKDITDQVCLAIEADTEWLTRYENLVMHYSSGGKKGKDIVNNSIGFYTKDLTGLDNLGQGAKAKSGLIQTYSRLGHSETS